MAMATKPPQPSHLLDVSISTVTAAVSVFLFTDPHPWFKGQWQWIYTNIPDCDMKDQEGIFLLVPYSPSQDFHPDMSALGLNSNDLQRIQSP